MVTVSGRQECALCGQHLGGWARARGHGRAGRGQAMAVESLQLFFHMACFRCGRCGLPLLQGSARGTDVHVSGRELRCRRCFQEIN